MPIGAASLIAASAQDSFLLIGAALQMARGFGSSPNKESSKKSARKLRGKILPCSTCSGSGKKPCQFCQGTTKMVGFLGKRVPCVPCEQTGILGIVCPECKGMGFLQM